MACITLRSARVLWSGVLLLILAVLALAISVSAGANPVPKSTEREFIFIDFIRVGHPLYLVTDFALTPDGRILVTEKAGRIRVVQPGGDVNPQLFLDLSDQTATKVEEGLVSIALHPDFGQNGYFYVNYTDLNSISRVERYQVSDGDPDVADPASAMTLLSVAQPSPIHNGAKLAFGPDGYLYVGFGDGGGQGDPDNNGQDGLSLLGSILRIDVDNPDPGKAYGIPADNPFVANPDVLDEIWAMGLRNPWRFSFDKLTGDLFIGDVGGELYEEINLERAPSPGGYNYGWRCYEGLAESNIQGCQDRDAYTFPIFIMAHPEIDPSPPEFCAVVGGVVHRGDPQSPLHGLYLLGDYCSGEVWAIGEEQPNQWQMQHKATTPLSYVTAFGQDESGEVYMADLGNIYRISARSVLASPVVHLPLILDSSRP
jgi:hypothetical protein